MHHTMATILTDPTAKLVSRMFVIISGRNSDPTYGHVDYSLSEPVQDISIFSHSDATKAGTIFYLANG